MKSEESLSKGLIKRIFFMVLVLLVLLGMGVLAGTSAVNTVTIKFADKTELTVVTTKDNIAEILKENNIYILDDEVVEEGIESTIGADKTITIKRKSDILEQNNNTEENQVQVIKSEELLSPEGKVIVEKIVKETVEIPFETITKEVTSKNDGEKVNKVVQEGQNGIKEITYKIKYENDVEIERTKVSEETIQEPVNKIIEVSVKVVASSRGSSAVRTGAGSWTYSAEDIDLLCAITAQESSSSYEGALAVITSACNRAEKRGTDPLTEYKRPNQYCYTIDSHWKRRLNGNYSSAVKKAVTDALSGVRNHPYTSFRSARTGKAGLNIGGNVYF